MFLSIYLVRVRIFYFRTLMVKNVQDYSSIAILKSEYQKVYKCKQFFLQEVPALLYYPEMVELSAQKKASSINEQAGKEVVSADKLIEQWKANNPRLGEKYDLLKEGRSKFDKEMEDGDIDKALEKFFETGYTPVQKLKNLYESLTTKITTIGKGIDEYTGEEIDIPVQRSEQDIFKQNLLGRLSTDADENPNKDSVSYYQKNGIKEELIILH